MTSNINKFKKKLISATARHPQLLLFSSTTKYLTLFSLHFHSTTFFLLLCILYFWGKILMWRACNYWAIKTTTTLKINQSYGIVYWSDENVFSEINFIYWVDDQCLFFNGKRLLQLMREWKNRIYHIFQGSYGCKNSF